MSPSPTLTTRQHGRAFALQLLYARDVDPSQLAHDSAAASTQWNDEAELEIDAAARTFAASLVEAAKVHAADIDTRITASSKNWRLERMSRVDRNILRLATAELLASPDVPVRVVINEAVELAKRFGTAESGAFVNGLLDRIAVGTGRSMDA